MEHPEHIMPAAVAEPPPPRPGFQTYLAGVSLFGLLLVALAAWSVPSIDQPARFALLLLLAAATQIVQTGFRNVRFSVSSAIGLAVVPVYGAWAAALVAATSELTQAGITLVEHETPFGRVARRAAFNVGMNAIAFVLAGWTLQLGLSFWPSPQFLPSAPLWLLAAIVNDQANIWLLIGILHLQKGVAPLTVWRDHRWAAPINILVTGLGGQLLALAMREYGGLGVAIFFLPILLSAYAFRLYVSETQKQMDHLEEIVTHRTRDLARANEELAALHKEKDAFLAVLTHDMRSPLTSILAYVSLLREQPELPLEKRQRILGVLLRNQETLLEIVNDILDLEKLEAGARITLDREQLNLTELLAETAETLAATADGKTIAVETDWPPEPVWASADRADIRRVMMNLLSNAIKYTPSGGRVLLKTWRSGPWAHFSVQDNGYGIPDEALPHLFERFRRIHQHQKLASGTGLGLAISHGIVDAHGGEITVESQIDEGSTFTVRLPA